MKYQGRRVSVIRDTIDVLIDSKSGALVKVMVVMSSLNLKAALPS